MSRFDRTPSNVMVTPLDLSGTEAQALAYLRDKAQFDRDHGQDAKMPERVKISPRWGIVETPQGLYALCTEGVGPDRPVTDEQPLHVDVFVDRHEKDGDNEFISMFPAAQAKLRPEALREYATGEPVALHDFIRSFGSRLEANYDGWKRLLENTA